MMTSREQSLRVVESISHDEQDDNPQDIKVPLGI